MPRLVLSTLAFVLAIPFFFSSGLAHAAGTLTPTGASDPPIRVLDHHVDVVIQNGFARVEVSQRFHNPADRDLEAIYSFPVPKSASLSEMTVFAGEQRLDGEVVARAEAERVYREERDAGQDAGLATKNTYQDYRFHIARVPAGAETRMRFVYYQPLEIDTGVARFVYPLEEGGTDEQAAAFWTRTETVDDLFSADIAVRSAWDLDDVRVPGFETAATIDRPDAATANVHVEARGAALSKDLVVYYRLVDDLPGRVEIVAHRSDPKKPGTFMAIVTPGLDLQPLDRGADYVFVLDVSGSMSGGKIGTLTRGVAKVVGELRPEDRYRIITFNQSARDVTGGFLPATPANVQQTLAQVGAIQADGSTNLYAGVQAALDDLDADRATSVVLVTDAVTNTGVVDPAQFHALLSKYDVRLFGFLLGNSGNWPLMRTIAGATGGFHTTVSNADDILGQILLAKSKVTHETLHGATLRVRGVDVSDTTGEVIGKVHRGQQLLLFGRYHEAGQARIALEANLTGKDKVYATTFRFPEQEDRNPEIERMWAMSLIEELEDRANAGLFEPSEMQDAVRSLGVDYQLVTDETAMIVLDDAAFARRGIDRRNRDRVAQERKAQQTRAQAPVVRHRVDREQPMFDRPAPSLDGGGAIDPIFGIGLLGLGALGARRARRAS